MTNAVKQSKVEAVHGSSSKQTVSHTSEKVLPHLQHISGVTTVPLGIHEFLLSCWNISVLIQKVGSQILNGCVKSNYVLRSNMIKLQFDFECFYFSQGLQTVPPFRALRD